MIKSSPDKNGKVYYGWWIVLVVSILSTYGSGIFYYGFSTFVKPVVNELAWSMTMVSYVTDMGVDPTSTALLISFIKVPSQGAP